MTEYVVFRIQQQTCAVPMTLVKQVLQQTAYCVVPEAPIWLAGLIEMDGQAVPLFDLHFSPVARAVDPHRSVLVLQAEHLPNRWFALRIEDAPILCDEADFQSVTAEAGTTLIDQLTRIQVNYAGQCVQILDSLKLSQWSQQQ